VIFQELTVDLGRPSHNRWHLTPAQRQQARDLLTSYKADLGLSQDAAEFLSASAKEFVRPDHWSEMKSLSTALGLPIGDVALGNFYYDALKVVLGCTAFAVDADGAILHARNLDWWTENAALARYTTVSHFIGGPAGPFITIGWPGFIGAFSGIAPGRFAVTLNAVLSLERAQPATPVVLLLRIVLEEARSFDEAAAILSDALLPCDCLFLLTGTRSGEMVVIERTPTRHAVRPAQDGFVCVTNDYQRLRADSGGATSELLATSCHRFQAVDALIRKESPQNPDTCFAYLSDPAVEMRITVQQMVFRPLRESTGSDFRGSVEPVCGVIMMNRLPHRAQADPSKEKSSGIDLLRRA
jgi:acid ceramidase